MGSDTDYPIRELEKEAFPPGLLEIPEPPEHLYIRGADIDPTLIHLAVVGSRNYSNYGKQAVEYLIEGLCGYPICIVSGLALGIDALAHEAALHAKLHTIAVPGSGLAREVLYPQRNRALAERILASGGTLLSEFDATFEATPWSFPQRNRIMAGMSRATLVIEASEKSGTLITARLAVDYNRDLLVVPGNIFSENSKGAHQFLKLGAIPITTPHDILDVLGIEKELSINAIHDADDEEQRVLDALSEPMDRDALMRALAIDTARGGVLLMSMELKGMIKESNGILYRT